MEMKMQVLGAPDGPSPLVRTIQEVTTASLRNTDLADHDILLVRLAILVAIDAPGISYLMNLAGPAGPSLSAEEVESVLAAAAPLVGTARAVAAAEKISDVLGYPISVVDLLAR
jgi:hypothetical protein